MKSRRPVSIGLLIVAWSAVEIALFEFSRADPVYALATIAAIPLAFAAVLPLLWRRATWLRLSAWDVAKCLIWSRVLVFHAYVLPHFSAIDLRDYHPMELVIQFASLLVQLAILLPLLSVFHAWRVVPGGTPQGTCDSGGEHGG